MASRLLCYFLLVGIVISVSMNIYLLTSRTRRSTHVHAESMTASTLPCANRGKTEHSKIATFGLSGSGNTTDRDKCHLNVSLQHRLYVYDLPWKMRELPRMHWYSMFMLGRQSSVSYNNTADFNFGFGDAIADYAEPHFYNTHMHSLEIILNERLKKDNYYITTDPKQALLFHIPFPFGLHFRFYHRSDSDRITGPHNELHSFLSQTPAFDYFGQKPHFLLYGRIAYESSRMSRLGSRFWSHDPQHNGEVETYWHVSIDRNCHGDPPQCLKRLSMPHPSNFHPPNVQALKQRIDRIKESWQLGTRGRHTMIAFCGSIRTPQRQQAKTSCERFRSNKYVLQSGYDQLCAFKDSNAMDEALMRKGNSNKSARQRMIELEYGTKCLTLYDDAVFCLQDGADSTTRKALWDGLVAGCIPVFLSGVMSAEFECFGGNNYPWYVVAQPAYYVKQLMSLSREYIQLLRRNMLRMIPKIVYTNGNAGFADAFDVLLHCIARKTSFENQLDNKGCTVQDVLAERNQLYDFDDVLGYTQLYEYLDI